MDGSPIEEQGSRRVRELLYGSWVAQAIHAAARLDIADLVHQGNGEIRDLSRMTETDPDALYRLMRALASVGVFQEEAPQSFALTPLASCLRSGVTDSVKDLALFYGGEVFQSYVGITESIRTGCPAFDSVHGTNIWDYLEHAPRAGDTFKRAMGAATWQEQLPLPRTCDFHGIRSLVDVGGGEGSMLAAILHEVPELRGILVDMPAGLDRTMRHFVEAGVADRCTLREGSAFDPLPRADGYLMSCLLHVMDDSAAIRALSRVRDAVEPGGRLIIVERLVPTGNEPGLAKLLDLSMLVVTGGRERAEEEWRELLRRTGFELTNAVPLPYFSGGIELYAIEASPA